MKDQNWCKEGPYLPSFFGKKIHSEERTHPREKEVVQVRCEI